jgi:S-adenosylmethionine:tRNA ribosyltransferase-isomerase
MMLLEDYDYSLPEKLIASEPLTDRAGSRLLHINRIEVSISDKHFRDLPGILRPGDLLVLNNTRVFPARLIGETETGAVVELLLQEEIEDCVWATLARPAKRLRPGKRIAFSESLACDVVDRNQDGSVLVKFESSTDLWREFETVGKVPLPHYIKRSGDETINDQERYQTVFAKQRGAIAAPTAGLHFTETIFEELRQARIQTVELTLHVGYGTFEPVRAENLSEHTVLPERFEISESAADNLNIARSEGRRIVAVGTTTTRALESAISPDGNFRPQKTRTSLTVIPGSKFRAVDALLTNFHLPKSSLLILVSTFGGHGLIMKAYEHAVRLGYRFYSYGDCMFIE